MKYNLSGHPIFFILIINKTLIFRIVKLLVKMSVSVSGTVYSNMRQLLESNCELMTPSDGVDVMFFLKGKIFPITVGDKVFDADNYLHTIGRAIVELNQESCGMSGTGVYVNIYYPPSLPVSTRQNAIHYQLDLFPPLPASPNADDSMDDSTDDLLSDGASTPPFALPEPEQGNTVFVTSIMYPSPPYTPFKPIRSSDNYMSPSTPSAPLRRQYSEYTEFMEFMAPDVLSPPLKLLRHFEDCDSPNLVSWSLPMFPASPTSPQNAWV